MISLIKGIFGGGGGFRAIESIAKEWIQTDIEKVEAQALLLKTLDPNGLMRRGLSERVAALYTVYLLTTMVLVLLESFALSPVVLVGDEKVLAVSIATTKLTELFGPITGLFGVIVTASFGVNYANVKSGK